LAGDGGQRPGSIYTAWRVTSCHPSGFTPTATNYNFGLGCDEARIHHRPFTADQSLVQAALHHSIEGAPPQDDAA